MLNNSISNSLVLKPYFSPETSSLSRRLLQSNVISMQPHQRLCSVEEAKKHPFFNGIDWVKLARKEVKPPFRPSTGEGSGVRNFDPVPEHRLAESPVAETTSQEKEALVFDQITVRYGEADMQRSRSAKIEFRMKGVSLTEAFSHYSPQRGRHRL